MENAAYTQRYALFPGGEYLCSDHYKFRRSLIVSNGGIY